MVSWPEMVMMNTRTGTTSDALRCNSLTTKYVYHGHSENVYL